MQPPLTKAEAEAYRRRWQLVNDAEREELRHTSVEQKFRQLAVLMASCDALGWTEQLAQEEEDVRVLWIRLRKIYRG
ncbi:MAG: hypothetical protein IH986_03250 [Planctomycetes bacterium]|nr:hypothetical protein [Planctomycetota bacterium]